jgi:hypothetical protein
MATFDFTVDTKPMAKEINGVSNHIVGTTTAVVAMQSAVIAAEKKASDHVCKNVNRGFYMLMLSQVTQKIAKLQSEVDSHFMKLSQLSKSLIAIKNRMGRDYNMLSSRYTKLFNGLNLNLKQRVFELDRPIINFALQDINKISNRSNNLTATVPIMQIESLSSSQKIIVSNTKQHALLLINSMQYFLDNMKRQKTLTNSILLNDYRCSDVIISIPIIISESNIDEKNNKSFDIYITDKDVNDIMKSSIKNTVLSKIDTLQWLPSNKNNDTIVSEFNEILSQSSYSKRIKDMTNKLFLSNNYQII